jgi:hypothetical protein
VSYVPQAADSKILVEFEANANNSGGGTESHRGIAVALFKNSDRYAFAATGVYVPEQTITLMRVSGVVTNEATTPITFKVRFGQRQGDGQVARMLAYHPSGNIITDFGGTNKAVLKITEYLQ